ncbi:MAG: SMC family ATPase [Selenomonadaceae bacterium]|nr:SMC family ATPase [Selenomonadaceae bacterium]
MRPIKLTMQAFGPYINPITLDFEKNLRGEKIFLIHGATGAGKTTILDAICFALYGTASGSDRDGVMMRSKGVSEKILTAVEFSFALGKKIYDVRRTLSYHPNRKSTQNILDAKLFCDGQPVTTQTKNVTSAITELLGFDVKQFRQVVLLPQGAFRNFLFAKPDERQPVLDTLFNAELYSRIEDALKVKADALQNIFDDLNRDKNSLLAQLQGTKLDETTLEKIRADYTAAQKISAELKISLDKAQREQTAGKILAGDFAELDRRNKSLETAQKNLEQAEKIFAAAKIEYDSRAGEQAQRDKLQSDADKLAEIKKALDELDGKQKALEDAEKILLAATDALKKCEADADKYDKRLAELKKQRNELIGADKQLAEAQMTLEKVREREKILQEISRLEVDLKRAQQKIFTAEKNFNAAQINLERLQKLQREGSAALLAENLRDGEPCPVCGSRIHQRLDFSEKIIPSDKEIETAQKNSDRLKKIFDAEKISAAQIQTSITNKRDDLKKFVGLPAVDIAQKIFDDAKKNVDALADRERRIADGEKYIADNKSKLDAARKKKNSAADERAKIFGAVQERQAQIPKKYSADRQQLATDLAALQNQRRDLDEAWKAADKNFRVAGNKKSSCDATFIAAQKAQAELVDKLKDQTPPDVDALKARVDLAQKNYDDAIRAETSLKNSLDNLTNLSAKISALDEKISATEKKLRVWRKLSDVACGKIRGNKFSFARYYLSAMFEQVLTEANYRLEKMSDRRYNLRNKLTGDRADSKLGLNLEILDDYTGETRPVATLSGGESFLASLSLALGLAAVVRNNLGGMKLDTIFIDEGFGSLDSETLDDAISTIMEQSGGRLVGIISHVEELKNQMPVRLEVTKTKTGSTAKFNS